MLLTSNIQGRSLLKVDNQDKEDPLLLLAQNIIAERKKGVDLYLDLGNGFYPGVISKFSSGSIMMDFFDFTGCAATLVASKDLQIGLQNLEFLEKSRNVHLLSANIKRSSGPVFTPFFLKDIQGVPIVFVGISSQRLEFDIAEKDLYGTELIDEKESLNALFKEIEALGIKHIVLLSGLRLSRTLKLMETYQEIDMALCGGDYTGRLFESKTSRIDLDDGRSIVMLDKKFDFFTVDIHLNDGIKLNGVHPHKVSPQKIYDAGYFNFRNRLTLWKEKYLAEQYQRIAQIEPQDEYILDDQRLIQLLRDRFHSEIAFVEKDTITPHPLNRDVSLSDLLQIVNLDYNIFTFYLTGDQVAKAVGQSQASDLVGGGYESGDGIKIQGYPLDSKRRYKVAATQPALRKLQRIVGWHITYFNHWETVTDILTEDLESDQITLRDDFSYLDNRFMTLVDLYLANYIISTDVDKGDTIQKPANQPASSYYKWGFEDSIDLTLYNQYHRFVLTPYLHYARQDEKYIQNLLRGTLLYEYNLKEIVRPYNKFQCDSVVEEVEGRPILLRETVGGSFYGDYFSGKVGFGFEKKVQDPAEDALYGFETIFDFKYPFLEYLTYTLHIDSFISSENPERGSWGARCETDNILSVYINTLLSFSLRHKLFYLYDVEADESYRNSQFFTTLDVKTDWKFW